MKVVILVLALVAVAYAAPVEEDANIEALIEKLLASEQQTDKDTPGVESVNEEDAKQENQEEERMLSFLAQMQADDNEEAIIEAYFAQDQSPAQLQGGWKRTWKKVKKFGKKHGPTLLKYGLKYLGR